ncbi:MAG: RNA-binding protein [Planctomycetota bacterium]|nr:MAG: RNA-binding protein [Planctomycetota bacterium]
MENGDFTRIYVGNLTPESDVYFLSNIFKDYGKITSAMTINDTESGETEGFGFIEMDSNEAAMKAIEELDGKEIDGIVLRVNWAKPKPKKSFRKRVSYQ